MKIMCQNEEVSISTMAKYMNKSIAEVLIYIGDKSRFVYDGFLFLIERPLEKKPVEIKITNATIDSTKKKESYRYKYIVNDGKRYSLKDLAKLYHVDYGKIKNMLYNLTSFDINGDHVERIKMKGKTYTVLEEKTGEKQYLTANEIVEKYRITKTKVYQARTHKIKIVGKYFILDQL